MKKIGLALPMAIIIALTATCVFAKGYPWRDHSPPFDFLFENSIDTHQQSKVSGGRLEGHFYIRFTGDFVDGFPEAVHGDETVGWILMGIPVQAKLISTDSGEHPTWCINPRDMPMEPGFTHFHWTGDIARNDLLLGAIYDGYLIKLTAVDSFFFVHDEGSFITPGIDYISHDNVVTNCN